MRTTPPTKPTAWYRADLSGAPVLRITVKGDRALIAGPAAKDALAGCFITGQWSGAGRGYVVTAVEAEDISAWASISRIRYSHKKQDT